MIAPMDVPSGSQAPSMKTMTGSQAEEQQTTLGLAVLRAAKEYSKSTNNSGVTLRSTPLELHEERNLQRGAATLPTSWPSAYAPLPLMESTYLNPKRPKRLTFSSAHAKISILPSLLETVIAAIRVLPKLI